MVKQRQKQSPVRQDLARKQLLGMERRERCRKASRRRDLSHVCVNNRRRRRGLRVGSRSWMKTQRQQQQHSLIWKWGQYLTWHLGRGQLC
jgi:hypothetical protein